MGDIRIVAADNRLENLKLGRFLAKMGENLFSMQDSPKSRTRCSGEVPLTALAAH
jgi:hypothetical protein